MATFLVRSDPWLKSSQIFFELARIDLLRPEIDFLISWQSTLLCQANRIERNYLFYIVDCFPPGTEWQLPFLVFLSLSDPVHTNPGGGGGWKCILEWIKWNRPSFNHNSPHEFANPSNPKKKNTVESGFKNVWFRWVDSMLSCEGKVNSCKQNVQFYKIYPDSFGRDLRPHPNESEYLVTAYLFLTRIGLSFTWNQLLIRS